MKIIYKNAAIVAITLAPFSGFSQEASLYSNGFENGLGDWRKTGNTIEIYTQDCPEGQNCVRISRPNRREYTYISQFFRVPAAGTLRFQARLKANHLVTGTEDYHRAKFVGVVIENNKEVAWPNNDLRASVDDWELRSFDVVDLAPSVKVDLRIGLQNAKGDLYVDDLKVFFIPD